ncbi:MAG: glycine--tRNA ligase [Rikenellaceae bacterium]|jgi:glycyl-tRNA synthetase|nr:glycine--tRNA ligase [Rikenellaceae bacterium]
MTQEELFKKLIAHSKEYGFIFPSSEIYDGLSAVYDYGQMGVELKNNIKNYWWSAMVKLHENIVGIDAAIFMHPRTWEASGHVGAFNDPLIDNRDSKKRYRADVLIEEFLAKQDEKIEKEVTKAANRFGETFDRAMFLETNPRVKEVVAKRDEIHSRMVKALTDNDLEELKQIILDAEIVDPVSGTRNWTDVRQFNLMFETKIGSVAEGANTIYLRPETAQGIFVNFLNVQKTGRMKIPFGIAQIGKAFRNEIVARQFIFRMREFEQMEMQFFVRPGEEMKWFGYWKNFRMNWHKALGFGEQHYRFHDHDKLAHYANAATDVEYQFPFGFKEVEGIHSRTDFDLGNHEKFSGRKLRYFDPESGESYVPYVVETSIGVDRMFLQVFSAAYTEEKLTKEDGSADERTVMKFPPALAPVKAAILPLVKKDGLPEVARRIMDTLKLDYVCQYDEKDSIGKRYRRQDAIGTPFCITVDHQSAEDNSVTIRHRDTMTQERVPIADLPRIIGEAVSFRPLFQQIVNE